MVDNQQNRKRKKSRHHNNNYHQQSNHQQSQPQDSQSSSTYIPNNSQIQLQLTNDKKDTKPIKSQSVDESKVLSLLSKFAPKVTITNQTKLTHITIILSESESQLLEAKNLKQILVDKFGIKDLVVENKEGNIDSLITIYGQPISISKAITFLVFVVNSQLNNLANELFTLKSSNYKIHLLLKTAQRVHGIKYMDNLSINYDIDSFNVFIQGDFNSIFNFLLDVIEHGGNEIDINSIKCESNFGIHLDPALKNISNENLKLKESSKSKLLKYLYNSSKLKQLKSENKKKSK
ncbi:hypothetical protein KGF54_001970 [Candida jiufengensis]|uniref:uncharacterized protein n=1 Tax=Candida jiufengensis TaxID=497108 RepID=UPI00222524F4|nr:uncharacterized protein KGF54_001970 [Candida jiufengensis]KAI5954195.1 hypothetical protein KGF54_001970 [Candida jiufengensis]